MEINALLMDNSDNVVTCVADVKCGETVCYRKGEQLLRLDAREDIPYCHKIALVDLRELRAMRITDSLLVTSLISRGVSLTTF